MEQAVPTRGKRAKRPEHTVDADMRVLECLRDMKSRFEAAPVYMRTICERFPQYTKHQMRHVLLRLHTAGLVRREGTRAWEAV